MTREFEPVWVSSGGLGGETPPAGYTVGRLKGLQVGTAADPDADYAAGYFYEAAGRLSRVSGPGLPGYGAVYAYDAGSGLLDELSFNSDSSTKRARVNWSYETKRDLVTAVRNRWSTTTVSWYKYQNDDAGRRESIVREGTALTLAGSAAHHDAAGYDGRSQLLETARYNNTTHGDTSSPVPGKDFEYSYDVAGNRLSHLAGDDADETVNYCADELNR